MTTTTGNRHAVRYCYCYGKMQIVSLTIVKEDKKMTNDTTPKLTQTALIEMGWTKTMI